MNTRRLAADPSIGPALVGVLRPRLVLPADFETRFDARERALILAHEEVYVNIGERFFLPDGSHNQEMWRFPPRSGVVGAGTQTPAFEVWAEELQPWLDRFVR